MSYCGERVEPVVNLSNYDAEVILMHGGSWGYAPFARKVARQLERFCKRRGKIIKVTLQLGNALEFEVTVHGHCCHSKIHGGGFISTKEKLIKCAVNIVKRLGADGKIITKDVVAETKEVKVDNVPVDGGACKMKARGEKK